MYILIYICDCVLLLYRSVDIHREAAVFFFSFLFQYVRTRTQSEFSEFFYDRIKVYDAPIWGMTLQNRGSYPIATHSSSSVTFSVVSLRISHFFAVRVFRLVELLDRPWSPNMSGDRLDWRQPP